MRGLFAEVKEDPTKDQTANIVDISYCSKAGCERCGGSPVCGSALLRINLLIRSIILRHAGLGL